MEDNKSKNPGKGKTLKIGRSHGGGYVPGSDVIGEFRTLGETKGLFGSTDYDDGLVHGLNQDDYAARQQSNWKAIGNSFVQLVTGTVGDIIATPGYVFEGVGAVAPVFGSSEEMDNIFIDAGNWLKGVGEEAAPIYRDQASKETLFNPFDGEWTANTIAQFGPTVAMLAATFLTEGLAYPALASRLSKVGQVGKHIANAEAWIQSGSKAAQLTKSARMAATSRMIEGGMEAYETFNSTYADLIRKGHSEEKAKKLAGDASARVYTNNFMLAAVDMLQFNGILDALGTAGKFSKLKGAANLGGQMGSEAFEEGYQYAVAQEAKNEIAYRLGEKKQDSTIFNEFLDGLSDTEMQQAMVQGALGGAVFTAVGKAATRIADNYKSKMTKAQKFQSDNNQYKLAEVNNQHVYDVINQHAQEGKLDVLKKSFQNAINTKGVTPEQAENSQKAISYIDYYDQIANSINEADPDVKEKKIKNLFAQRFNEEYISDVSSQLSQYETDINAQKKSAAEKLKAAKKAKNESLIKKYEEEVRQLKETEKGSPTPTSNDTIIERLANLVVTAENNLDTARKEFKEFNSKEKREEVKKEKAEQIRQERLSEVQTEATKAQTPSQLEVQKDAYKNDTEALDILKAVENNKAKSEVGNTKEPITTDVDTILDYYKDKPFARKRKFNVNTQDELISKLGPASTTETTNEDKGKKFLEGAAKAQKEAKEESKKEVAETTETTEPASKELPPAVESTSTLPKKEKPIKQILNESVENESRKEAKPSEIDQVPQEEETNNSESEELEQAFENEDGKDQSYAQVYDTGLFKFQKFKGQWGIYLNHIQGGFIPVDSVEEVRDGNGDYLYHKVDSSSINQYHIPKKLRINEYYPLKDSKGYPIKSTFGNVIRDYNIDAVKELYKYKDEEVFIEIDTQDNFNATQQSGRIRIDYVIYPNGVRTVIGVMPAVKEYSKDSYKEIRQQIFNELIANNRTPNTESKTFRYSKSTKIGKILGGRFNTFYDKSQRNNPKSVINDNNPLILGVGYNIPGNFDSYDIHLNLNVEDNRENNLQPPNSKLAEFAKDKPIKKGRLTTGQPYVLVRNANNDLIPIRVFSKPVKSVPRLRDKLLNLIREFKKDAAAEIIKFNVVNKKGVKKLIPDFDNNLSDIYSGVKVVLADGKIQFKSQLGGANFSIQKNSEGVEYSTKGLTEGMILVDTTSNTNYQLTEKVNGKWQVQKLDSKFNKVGESTSAEFLNEAMAQGNIELHYAYNYYMFYDMDNRPLQIDHKKVNIGNYNETVANERLESDLVPKNNFASPKFQVDLASLYKKPEKVTRKVQPTKPKIKKGVPELFDANPELASIGTQEQYSQYLDTIFPDSKVKDIVYHFSNVKIDTPNKEKFSLSANINRRKGFFAINKNVNPGNNFANVEGTILHLMLFNMRNPDYGDFSIVPPVVAKDETKDSAIIKQRGDIFYYAVFKPEQIHILGSKQDIKGFKEFVSKQTSPTSKTVSKGIKVEQYTITEKGGKYFYENGNEVTDEVTINKYLVKRDYDPNRKVSHANTEYYVLPDNRIISLGKTTKGKERYKSGKTREKILAVYELRNQMKLPTTKKPATTVEPTKKRVKKEAKSTNLNKNNLEEKLANLERQLEEVKQIQDIQDTIPEVIILKQLKNSITKESAESETGLKVGKDISRYYINNKGKSISSLTEDIHSDPFIESSMTEQEVKSFIIDALNRNYSDNISEYVPTQTPIKEEIKGIKKELKELNEKTEVNTPETTIESKPTETGESPVEGKVLSPLEMMRRKRATKKDTPQKLKIPAEKEIREQVGNLLTKEKIALEEAYEEAKQDASNSQDNSTLEKFVSNQVVNYNTGKKVMSKIKDTIKKISKAILSVAVISSLYFTNTAFISPDTKIEKSEFFTRAANGVINYQDSISVDNLTLTGNAAKVYALQQNNFNKGELKSGYVIADKPNARVLIFDSSNNLVKEFPSIFGANYGDQQFKVSIAWENLTPEGKAKFKNPYNYYNQLGIPKITPAGTFKLSKLDNTDYGSEYIYALEGTNSGGLINAFHPNIKSTIKNLKSSNIEDNKASFGCVSVSIENWKNFVEPNLNSDSVIFVLPDSESTEFNPESIGTSVDPYVWDVSNKLEKLGVEIPKFKTVDSNKPREVWNKEEELAWLKENLPNVSNKVYDSLTFLKQFGINGYGAFYNGAIHLLESAQAGTTYHEAFHAVFNMYLSEKEASRILRAADKRYNVSSKEVSDMIAQVKESGIDISETEAKDLVLEEKLADDFMEYVKARSVEKNTSITGRIKRFFEGLYNFITSLVNNKPTIDQLFWRINERQFANKEFKRDVSSILPKFKKHPLYPNPAEYQRVIDTMTSVLDDVLSTFREQNPDTPIKDIVKNNLLFPSKAEVTAEDLADNLILSLDNENSVYNKVLDRMAELDSQGILDEETAQQFNDFLNALAVPVEKEDGTISLRPKLLAFDILKNLSSRGIIINLDTRKLEEDEFGRAEIEPDNTDFVEENDMREAWQILSFTISQLDKLGEKLKFEFNKIPVVKWTDSSKTEVTPVEGFLSFNKHYNLGHVYRQVQQVAGNSFSRLNMENKLRTAALSKPMFKYIMDTYGSDNDFLGLLWIHIGQKQHPKFVSAIQDKDSGKVRSKVIPTNSVSKVNKITENLVGSLFTNSSLFTSTGKPNVEKAKEVNSKFNKIKEVIKNHYSSNAGKKLPDNILESFYEALQSINLSIPIEALEYANDRNNKDFRKVMTNKTNSIYSFIENIANGKDPIEEGNDGIKNFVKQISSGYDYDVQDAHKNSTGGQVYEWLDSNFLGRTILELKDKVAGIKKIQSLQQDMYYQFSPLLNLIKNGHSETPNNIDYYLNPNEINFAIPSEIKMVGESLPTEYSNMSERQLYINLLMLYYNSNHVGNKAYLPLPVHADSPTMTAIEIPVIKNLNTKETGQKGILDYLNDAAYQELVRVNLDRTTTKNQKSKNRDSNGSSKFLFFDVLESNTPTFKGLNKKKELLSLDLEQDQDRIREILAEVVEEQYNNTLIAERTKMEELNIISYNSEKDKYEWKDDLLNNTPVEVFAEHFVANFMLFQNQFTGLFNGDLSYYKNVGDYYKRAKQIWSPGTYLDTTQTRVNFNAKILKTNAIDKNMKESSYDAIYAAALALYGDESVAKKVAAPYEKGVDETDAQSYIDLFRYKEQQDGLHRWSNTKEQSYRRLLKGEFNIQDMENLELFNVNKPFYFGFHYNDATKEVYPVQNKNSEAIIIPAFANPNNTFYNSKFKEMLLDMGYNEDGTIDNIEEFEAKRRAPNNNLTDQFVFDSAIKLGLFGESDNIKEAKTHKFNNSDWRLQMETPIHHVNDKVVFATQVRKHMLNDLEMDSKIYRDPDNPSNMITGAEWLEKYNEVIIKDIQESYSKVSKKFDNFDSLINTLREEVIKRDLGDQYLQALDYWKEQVTDVDGNVTEVINTKLPLWHPLHLYRIESMLNSLFTKGVTRQELTNGVTLANMSSYGFRDKPKLVFNKDGSLNYMEAYAPVYDKKLYPYIDENGKFNEKQFDKDYGKGASEKALRGIVWRIPNEDKYSTFSIRIKGFLPQETGGTIVLPPEVTTIAGLD